MALHFMDWVGIDRAFLIQGLYYGWHNDERVAACRQWPDRFSGFALVRPDDPQSAETLERTLDAGLCGMGEIEVAIYRSLYPAFDLRSEPATEWWRVCNQYGAAVILHLSEGTAEVGDVLWMVEEYDRLQVIIAHLGLPPAEGWQEQVRLGKHPRVFVEMSALPGLFADEGYPYPSGQAALEWAVSEVGDDRILWGSDFPAILKLCTLHQTLDLVRQHCHFLDSAQRDLVLGGNAARLLARIQ
jgi:predicted TIM-barrel fold metal-dependent hydrolase